MGGGVWGNSQHIAEILILDMKEVEGGSSMKREVIPDIKALMEFEILIKREW